MAIAGGPWLGILVHPLLAEEEVREVSLEMAEVNWRSGCGGGVGLVVERPRLSLMKMRMNDGVLVVKVDSWSVFDTSGRN